MFVLFNDRLLRFVHQSKECQRISVKKSIRFQILENLFAISTDAKVGGVGRISRNTCGRGENIIITKIIRKRKWWQFLFCHGSKKNPDRRAASNKIATTKKQKRENNFLFAYLHRSIVDDCFLRDECKLFVIILVRSEQFALHRIVADGFECPNCMRCDTTNRTRQGQLMHLN